MAWSDADIGANVARLRGSMSQKDLAAIMRSFDWKWSQATVWSVEKGERPLRLSEAADLATILGPLNGATISPQDLLLTSAQAGVSVALRDVRTAARRLDVAARAFVEAHDALSSARSLAEKAGSVEMAAAVEEWIAVDPLDLVRRAQGDLRGEPGEAS